MDRPRHRAGDKTTDVTEITEGTLYRRIPNWPHYFDHRAGKPRHRAFEPRPQDQGALSMDLDRGTAELALHKYPGFGLCSLDIGQVRAQTRGKVRVVRSSPDGSHVRVFGCSYAVEAQEILASLAQVIYQPIHLSR